jgi:outer membrane protein, heavy metal efflux system
MRVLVVFAAVAMIFVPFQASAQSSALSEADALARLSPDSPRVRAIRAAIEIARADVLAASRWPNPRFTWDRESVAGITEHMTMVAQPLPITGRRDLERSAAVAMVDATASRTEDEMRRARADLRLAYAQLQAAQGRERELVRSRDRLRALADILKAREEAGEAAGFDPLRAEREVLDTEADRFAAATDRSRAQGTLVGFFSGSIDPLTIVATDGPAVRPVVPSVDVLVEHADTARGDLAALRHEVEAARFSERAADRRRIPEPEVVAGTKSSTVGGGDTGTVITFHVQLPLFDRGQVEGALARARAAQAESRLEASRTILRAQIAALRAVVLERREAADQYRAAALKSADQIERIAQISYDAGERSILELLDAYRTTASARVRQTALDAAVREAEIELEFVSAWEMP